MIRGEYCGLLVRNPAGGRSTSYALGGDPVA